MTDTMTDLAQPPATVDPVALLHRTGSGVSTRPRPATRPLTLTAAQLPPRHRYFDRLPGLGTVLVAAVCVLVVAVVHGKGMYTAPIRFDDEGTYVAQANAVLTQGRLAPYTYWYDHPPLGWLMLAGWLGGPGALWHAPNLIGSGRQLMLVLDLVSVVLLVVLARRIGLTRLTAAAAALLYALTPLGLTYHRMVLLDNIATPLMLGAFVLALSPHRRLAAALGSGLLMSSAVLVKETTLLLVPFVLFALWQQYGGATRRMCLAVFALGVALPASLYPIYAVTNGELLPGSGHVSLWSGIYFQLLGRRSSGSVFDPSSDAHAVAQGWFSIDGHLLLGAAALVLPALAIRRLRPIAGALLFLGLAALRPGYLPVPYIVAPIPFAAIVVAGVTGTGAAWLVRRVRGSQQNQRPGQRAMRRAAPLGNPARTSGARRQLAGRALAAVTLSVVGAAVVIGVQSSANDWYYRDLSLMQTSFDRPYLDSTAWIEANVPHSATLLVDDVTWTSLLQAGYPANNLIWFTKPNADPAVDQRVPSWRSVHYVISSDIMRTSRENGGTVRDAVAHSVPVASWGSGSNEIEIRKVGP